MEKNMSDAVVVAVSSGLDFTKFKQAVSVQFQRLSQQPSLFNVGLDGDALWETYLASFPVGTNPMYRKRTEHDCSCCRGFIKRVGKLITVSGDGKRESIWDAVGDNVDPAYRTVAEVLRNLVISAPIANVYLTDETVAGNEKSFESLVNDVKAWDHFFVRLPSSCITKKAAIGPKQSDANATHDVMARGLSEITTDAVSTVLELIGQNSLYRGEENKFAVESFGKLQQEYAKVPTDRRDDFVWSRVSSIPASVARIRNTAIGTLLVSLSEPDADVDAAVRAFESVVAPANYKRPTALVTKAQVEKAKQTIESLGLTSALQRRFANLKDITANNILFADRSIQKELAGGDVFAELSTVASTPRRLDKVEEIGIEKFLSDVLPKVTSVEVFLENKHTSNLVSLIAPVDPTANPLFKWSNPFSWSYAGEMADAIKERVKAAGGVITGDLCCRLAWEYTDDLDFHCFEPNGYHIDFGNRRRLSPNGGILDLDANGCDGVRSDPAENIYYSDKKTMKDGIYTLKVNNYSRRSDGKGFVVEIEFDGVTHRMEYDKALRGGETIEVAKVQLKKGEFSIVESLPTSQTTKEIWGLKTQNYHRVSLVSLSPNHWDGNVGNKHYFFMLDGCQNDATTTGGARGFFNEFLKEELNPHRKVLEMVGGKMKVLPTADQLSGLGFSSTARNTLVCRVKGSFTRTLKVVF